MDGSKINKNNRCGRVCRVRLGGHFGMDSISRKAYKVIQKWSIKEEGGSQKL